MVSSELEVINEIKGARDRIALWLQNNSMKVNPDEFHLLCDKNIHQVDICNEKISSACNENLLKIKDDNKLAFRDHVENSALARIWSFEKKGNLLLIHS